MPSPISDAVREEIVFFREKAFQVSFGYLVGLTATLAAASFDKAQPAAESLNTRVSVLVALFVLVLNFVYMTLSWACLFGILKRGYYFLADPPAGDEENSADVIHWESFVRGLGRAQPPWRGGGIGDLAWNIDNYFMVPVYALILMGSVCAAVWTFVTGNLVAVAAAGILSGLHVIPFSVLVATARLNRACRDEIAAAASGDTTSDTVGS